MGIRILPASEVRDRMASIVEEITRDGEPCYVTQYGKAKAVLLSIDRYEVMMDLLEDKEDEADSELAKRVKEARAHYKAGKGRDFSSYLKERG